MNIPELTIDERIKLVEDIWDSIVLDNASLPVTPEQRGELDRRLAQFKIDGNRGTPANLVIERVRSRL
jgi:putative addiction module component (TIGR02574 family)